MKNEKIDNIIKKMWKSITRIKFLTDNTDEKPKLYCCNCKHWDSSHFSNLFHNCGYTEKYTLVDSITGERDTYTNDASDLAIKCSRSKNTQLYHYVADSPHRILNYDNHCPYYLEKDKENK